MPQKRFNKRKKAIYWIESKFKVCLGESRERWCGQRRAVKDTGCSLNMFVRQLKRERILPEGNKSEINSSAVRRREQTDPVTCALVSILSNLNLQLISASKQTWGADQCGLEPCSLHRLLRGSACKLPSWWRNHHSLLLRRLDCQTGCHFLSSGEPGGDVVFNVLNSPRPRPDFGFLHILAAFLHTRFEELWVLHQSVASPLWCCCETSCWQARTPFLRVAAKIWWPSRTFLLCFSQRCLIFTVVFHNHAASTCSPPVLLMLSPSSLCPVSWGQ